MKRGNMQRLNKKVDSKGRINLPSTFRKQLNISDKDELEIALNDNSITIAPVKKKCVFCGKPAEYTFINGNICKECVVTIKQKL